MHKITIALEIETLKLAEALIENSPESTMSAWIASLIKQEGQRVAGFNRDIAKMMETVE